jgi:hypothetical protein
VAGYSVHPCSCPLSSAVGRCTFQELAGDTCGIGEQILRKHQVTIVLFLLSSDLFLYACGLEQVFNPTPSSQQTTTPASTNTSVPELTSTDAASTITMNCGDGALIDIGDYQAQNNTWGKGNLSGWSQCIGLAMEADGTLAGRWTWDWLNSGSNVKAYPEIIFGQKPGSATTTKALPIKLSDIGFLTVSYDVSSNNSGSGNVAFDIWLTDTPNPIIFGTPPITHEIMVWLDQQGGLGPSGNFKERVNINGSTYAVFVAPKWGEGWEYVAFFSPESRLGAGTLDLGSLLAYMQETNLATGAEYLASIEFGNEIVTGSGETIVKSYSVSLKKK